MGRQPPGIISGTGVSTGIGTPIRLPGAGGTAGALGSAAGGAGGGGAAYGRIDCASALAATVSIGSLEVPSHTTNQRLAEECACGLPAAPTTPGPDLAVRLGGVGELHVVGGRGARHVPRLQHGGLLIEPGARERHEELTHVGSQPDGGLGVVRFGTGW